MSYDRYREKRNWAKRAVYDAKVSAEWDWKLMGNFQENVELFLEGGKEDKEENIWQWRKGKGRDGTLLVVKEIGVNVL